MNRFLLSLLTLTALCLTHSSSVAGGDEVVVIYNTKVPESRKLAEYYAEKRQVPKEQVLGFELPANEQVGRFDFRDELQRPLFKKLEALKLWKIGTVDSTNIVGSPIKIDNRVVESKIRYLVLCYGMPLRILPDPGLKEFEAEKMRPEFRRNEAAVDSELTWLPLLNQKFTLAGPAQNPVYGVTNAAQINPTNGVLIVARLDGPTPEIARGLVDKSLQAERDGLWGRAYVDLRNATDPGLKQGDDWMRVAADVCRVTGFDPVVENTGALFSEGFPMSQIAFYAGWYSENPIGPFTAPKMEFMPGAFAYHLHSFSAASLRTADRNWVGPLLKQGVTATMGTVDEPYLGGTPDIGAFAARFLYYGMSFGEAAAASLTAISWQTTVVGDPLYRPTSRPLRQLHEDLEARHSPLIEWSQLRVANLSLARGGSLAETTTYLEELPNTKTSAVLSEKLADLYAAAGKPTSAFAAYEQALQNSPTPLQRLRLRLSLGDKLSAQGRDEEALANYEKLLQENAGYADRLAIYQKLQALASKLGKNEAAAKYEEQVKLLSPPPPK